MDIARVGELQEGIARDLVAQAPAGWERIEATVVKVAGAASIRIRSIHGDSTERFQAREATVDLSRLQDAMYDDYTGTWFSATCTIDPPGQYSFSFNHDEPVVFNGGREPLEESWIKELRRHPRPWDLIPSWHPVKQRYSEAQWLADSTCDD